MGWKEAVKRINAHEGLTKSKMVKPTRGAVAITVNEKLARTMEKILSQIESGKVNPRRGEKNSAGKSYIQPMHIPFGTGFKATLTYNKKPVIPAGEDQSTDAADVNALIVWYDEMIKAVRAGDFNELLEPMEKEAKEQAAHRRSGGKKA